MYNKLTEPDDDENDMLDLAFGLTETYTPPPHPLASSACSVHALGHQNEAKLHWNGKIEYLTVCRGGHRAYPHRARRATPNPSQPE
jgi:hypothetical protein